MSLLSPRLRRLDGALAALAEDHGQAMLLTTLDGYLTGILLSPEAIGPEEWLPPIWDGEAGTPPFPDERDAKWFADLVADHSRAIAAALAKGGRYKPVLEVDHGRGEVLWELWIDGFVAAVELRPASWVRAAGKDERAAEALASITDLIEIARDESDLERDQIEALTHDAPELIAGYIQVLKGCAVIPAHPRRAAAAQAPAKIGRNVACPCGSGRKHKRCCGLA